MSFFIVLKSTASLKIILQPISFIVFHFWSFYKTSEGCARQRTIPIAGMITCLFMLVLQADNRSRSRCTSSTKTSLLDLTWIHIFFLCLFSHSCFYLAYLPIVFGRLLYKNEQCVLDPNTSRRLGLQLIFDVC